MARPDWWEENEAIRRQLDLPAYEPPRLSDGVYTHEIVPELEEQHDCRILFIGIDTTYPEAWELRIDGETAATIDRRRDARGNTVYGLSASELRDRVESHCQS